MTNYGESAPDPLGEAVKKVEMHVAAAGVHGPTVYPERQTPNEHPEHASSEAAQAEVRTVLTQSDADIAGGILEDRDALPASTEFANQTLEKAANWIITPVDDLPPPLDLTKGMQLPE